jgi:hypothetical protein
MPVIVRKCEVERTARVLVLDVGIGIDAGKQSFDFRFVAAVARVQKAALRKR